MRSPRVETGSVRRPGHGAISAQSGSSSRLTIAEVRGKAQSTGRIDDLVRRLHADPCFEITGAEALPCKAIASLRAAA